MASQASLEFICSWLNSTVVETGDPPKRKRAYSMPPSSPMKQWFGANDERNRAHSTSPSKKQRFGADNERNRTHSTSPSKKRQFRADDELLPEQSASQTGSSNPFVLTDRTTL